MTAKRHDEKEIVAGMQTKTRARPYVKCCVVEQKSESKGRSERRVRKVAEEHIMVCWMQLEMIAEEKKQGCVERLLEKTYRIMCDCMVELGVDRKWTLHQTKAKMTQRQQRNK